MSHQWTDIPQPKFQIGQRVQYRDARWSRLNCRIAGMVYTSRDVALSYSTKPGWLYTVEIEAFQSDDLHDTVRASEIQEVAP